MGPPSYMRSVVGRNVVMGRIPVKACGEKRRSKQHTHSGVTTVQRAYSDIMWTCSAYLVETCTGVRVS